MRKLFTLLLLVLAITSGSTQDLVPSRVAYEMESNVPPLTGEILHSEISKLQPIILASDGEIPHNTILVDRVGDTIWFRLMKNGLLVDTVEFNFIDNGSLIEECRRTASAWESYFGMVESDMAEEFVVERDKVLEVASFNQSITTPFQMNLWFPISGKYRVTYDNDFPNEMLWMDSLHWDFLWFFSESFGITTGIQFSAWNGNGVLSSLSIKPGLGVLFRSIGKISAELGLSFWFDIMGPSLSGNIQNTWEINPLFEFYLNLSWNIDRRWSMKAKLFSIEQSLLLFTSVGESNSSTPFNIQYVDITFLQLGAAYRW